MALNAPTVDASATVRDVEQLLLGRAKDFANIQHIYVLGADKVLSGVFSVKELFSQPKEALVSSVMITKVISATANTDQEHVALLAITHGLTNVPVVDEQQHFLGIVTHDTILKVLDSEAIEDFLRMGGIAQGDFASPVALSLKESLRRRLPWLIVGLGGGLLAALVVRNFEATLEAQIALAAFIPVVVYIADAVGAQVEIIFIRRLAIDAQTRVIPYFFKELFVSGVIGLIIGACAAVAVAYWWSSAFLASVVGVSIGLGAVVAALIAVLLPSLFAKFKFDPAMATGPLATVVADISSLLIYFTVTIVMMRVFA